MIHFPRYSPWSPFYGVPSIMPAWNALTAWALLAEYNLQFFANNAVPDYAVILEGEWGGSGDDESGEAAAVEMIREYFRTHLKGQAHKTMVLEAPTGGKVTFQKLTSDQAKEGSFRLLRKDSRDEIIHAHGVPPQIIGIVETGALGGNVGAEQIGQYKDSIVTPGQKRVAAVSDRLIAEAFEAPELSFEFEEYDAEDREANSRVDSAYLDRRVLLPNEVRNTRFPEMEPLDGGDDPLNSTPPGLGELALAVGKIAEATR